MLHGLKPVEVKEKLLLAMDQILRFITLNVSLVLLLVKESLYKRTRDAFWQQNFNIITDTWNFTVGNGVRLLLLFYLQQNDFMDELKETYCVFLEMPEICPMLIRILPVYEILGPILSLYIFLVDYHLNQYTTLKQNNYTVWVHKVLHFYAWTHIILDYYHLTH